MRIFPSDPTCYLAEPSDVEGDALAPPIAEHGQSFTQIVHWAREYLCKPHPQLGRAGPVCPFVQFSMNKGLFFLTCYDGQNLTPDEVGQVVLTYRNWFLEIEPREGKDAKYKTILILFPHVSTQDAPQMIDATQARLKPDFVAKGLMIGQFHAAPPAEPGLWNQDFRPLDSPIPMLVIRHMVPTDFPFLQKDGQFVAAYIKRYGTDVPEKLKAILEEAALRFDV